VLIVEFWSRPGRWTKRRRLVRSESMQLRRFSAEHISELFWPWWADERIGRIEISIRAKEIES
jgi:hypothetical protein